MVVQPNSPQVASLQGAPRGASAPPATSAFRTGHRRSRSTSSPPTNATNSQERFEDARSSIHRVIRQEVEADAPPKASIPEDTLDDDLDFLPPLETFFNLVNDRAGSINSCLESDLFPSTPLTDEQMRQADKDFEGGVIPLNRIPEEDNSPEIDGIDPITDEGYIRAFMHNAAEQGRQSTFTTLSLQIHAEEFAITVWHKLTKWKVTHFQSLPQWLQDNDFLHFGHRPPLPTSECFKSIVRIHTETGNIWTHLLGVVAFFGLGVYYLTRPLTEIQVQEKIVFACFFAGAMVCMGLSFLYHTLCCHNNKAIGRLFAKFDYCGISFLTVGSFVPWLYYSFYCDWRLQVIYLSIVLILGIGAVVVSTFDFFAGPRFRPLRAGVFITFGLSGIAPATHYCVVNGWDKAVDQVAIGWLILMGCLYITGALLYAVRIPERFFPGKLDIWFHSHQIFHCFVMAGAFVHYHGISQMAIYRLQHGECPVSPVDIGCIRNVTSSSSSSFMAGAAEMASMQ